MTTDDLYDFGPVPDSRMALRLVGLGAATGALAGGVEGLVIGLSTRLPLSSAEATILSLGAAALDAGVGAAAGLVGGLVAQLLLGRLPRWKRYRAGFTLAVALLAAFFLAPLARDLWAVQQRRGPAIGMVALWLCVAATVWFNAGYWFRREMIGAGPRLGWRLLALGVTAIFALITVATAGTPSVPLTPPLPDAPTLVLVTVDTLRRDHVGVYGSLVNTPVLDGLAREGAVFDNAVTPVPETAPSHATMLTGLHPVQHKVVANGIPLRRGYLSLPEQLEAVGYRTGAFVSSFAVDSGTGLSQGFQVYDDDFVPTGRGLSESRVARVLTPLLMRLGNPTDFPWLLERAAPDTIERALGWVGEVPSDAPLFLWVHLFEPHSPYEPHGGAVADVDHRAILEQEPGYAYTPEEEAALRALYRGEAEYTDAQIGALLDGLRTRGRLEGALVVVVADHGESLGEHGIRFNHHGLYDEVLRVPLIVWTDRPGWTPGARVDRQVTVGDVANTFVEWVGVPLMSGTESTPLLTHVRDATVPARPVTLIGRLTASLSEGQLCGVRDPRGVKYIRGPGREELYDLTTDPGELQDIAAQQPNAVRSGQMNVAMLESEGYCRSAPAGDVAGGVDERLKALGYAE